MALNDELRRALELEGTAVGCMLMPWFDDEWALTIAAQLDECVDRLIPGMVRQASPYARAIYVDLLMALALTAESVRRKTRGDQASADQHVASASKCLARVTMREIVFQREGDRTDGSIWD
ncbi:hypothetical protein FHX82_001808 [Amycolatopsis bartoniae]|uniref:Uncharacterized protein n=1 Tax=Amycolatopsis bartoniae TaxID=941986 RepID=A0A8H9MCJ4_9PSEU|nr:hypothetical protein [Amycolatopsis bartoniae]MBB2934788.1 hypothetical protein [Amycolatopsis bartoniae]TVT02424.1 hypothetical protein FNH07_27310 [Amycolatopsis bartoniae]GHF44723.1 hypothetical protein GCM10017566_17180 [Amycolatopsis bartoniae]